MHHRSAFLALSLTTLTRMTFFWLLASQISLSDLACYISRIRLAVFDVWLLLLSLILVRLIHFVLIEVHFYCHRVFLNRNIWTMYLCAFYTWWTFELFPFWGYYKQSDHNHSCMCLLVHIARHFVEDILRTLCFSSCHRVF